MAVVRAAQMRPGEHDADGRHDGTTQEQDGRAAGRVDAQDRAPSEDRNGNGHEGEKEQDGLIEGEAHRSPPDEPPSRAASTLRGSRSKYRLMRSW